MNIREIIIYSHSGKMRRISLKVNGLNVITGRSSTGKSSLSEIVEYCMGRSTFNIPEGTIRDKVAWYAVIYQFSGEQVLVAKPTPENYAASSSKAMIRRGTLVEPPPFNELQQNADDDTVVSLLSELLGIPDNRTQVPQDKSRDSYKATIQHTYFYLFQKQGLIANKDQLFYRQNEQFIPQSIKDTLPILLGVTSEKQLELDYKLRVARRDSKIAQKQLSDLLQFNNQINDRALSLILEAQEVGILSRSTVLKSTDEALEILNRVSKWKPTTVPDEDIRRIAELEEEISAIRKERTLVNESLQAANLFVEKENGFTTEAKEQKSRLQSIHALPSTGSGEWQWPFAPENLGLKSPIAQLLLQELESLDKELEIVAGERPHLEKYKQNLEQQIFELNQHLKSKEEALSAVIAANAAIAEMGNRNAAAAKIVGRISFFLETYQPDNFLATLKMKVNDLQLLVTKLEKEAGADDSEERLSSILNIISNRISYYVKDIEAEFAEHPFRLDFSNLTVVIDRPDRPPVPMNKTGGGANHLAYHLGALLAFHYFATNNKKPIPSFLFIDQPTQVYFPSEKKYKNMSGSIEDTERDADLEKVRKLFEMLYRFATQETKNFQIIVTEHANLRDNWFQESIVEAPWTKPPALVPDEW